MHLPCDDFPLLYSLPLNLPLPSPPPRSSLLQSTLAGICEHTRRDLLVGTAALVLDSTVAISSPLEDVGATCVQRTDGRTL
jgi:hypothetical protein